MDYPPRFEDEYPDTAAFMARVFAAGGKFKQPKGDLIILPKFPPIRGIPRNAQCPCGSSKKTKVCHPSWTEN